MLTAGIAMSTILRSYSFILPPPGKQQLKTRGSRRRETPEDARQWWWEGEAAPTSGAVAEGVVLP